MKTLSKTCDLVVVGSGFAGSLLSTIARRLGHSVILLEKSKHPRFAIGESATPLANLLLEELTSRYDLPRLLPLTKWGRWQRTYPEIACGLKRGFTFYHHVFGRPFSAHPNRSDQLLVAASPNDSIADTHWYRPDFDHFLVREAQDAGVEYLDEVSLDAPVFSEGKVVQTGNRQGEPVSINSRFVVDATGPRGFLHRALNLSELPFENLSATQGLYTHFEGVRRLADMANCRSSEAPPFPIDDAAVHHVFEGGWIWVLRFNNGITSAGVGATDELAKELRFSEGAPAWKRLLQRLPTVAEQFIEARQLLPFVHAPRLSFRSGAIIGGQWALLPSAAGFIDPLLSTGFPLTLLGVLRLAEAFEHDWNTVHFRERLQAYEAQTTNELLAAERLIGALYANMNDFALFSSLSLLYFTAASFTETARRLGRPQLAESFLLHDQPGFGTQSRSCFMQAMRRLTAAQKAKLMKQIRDTIEPFDVAGLGDPERRNWYPMNANDLLNAAGKLEANKGEIEELLKRSGFFGDQDLVSILLQP